MEYTLRPFRKEDAPAIAEYANNWNIAKYLSDSFPHPYSIEDANNFIEMATKDDPIHIFTVDIGGKASGGVGLHFKSGEMRKNMELGYWLAEPFWGNGIISSAIPQVVKFGFEHYDITRIFARSYGNNIGSQRVLEKAGFTFEAKFEKTIFKGGEFVDEFF